MHFGVRRRAVAAQTRGDVEKRGLVLSYPEKTLEEGVISSAPVPVLTPVRAFRAGAPEAQPDNWSNMLIEGDNLGVLRTLLEMKGRGELVCGDGTAGARLVYIDPPFSTNLTFRTKGSHRAFDDKVTGAEFVEFLRKRLILIRELLTADGSVFVHLDWKMVHYVKVILDEVFGPENFLNDIVWSYGGRGAKAVSGQFSRNHDNILWYARGDGKAHVFNRIYTEKRIRKGEGGFRQDAEGRWFKTAPRGDYTDDSIAALEKEGRVHRTRGGKIRIKYFLKEDGEHLIEKKLVGDVWDDIPDAMHVPRGEKTGYPTQKPEGLLARIIRVASNPGDVVLDAFCGAGTTPTVAEKLGRRWVAVDSGRLAVHTTERRLLTLADSSDPGNSRRRYKKPPRPFDVYMEKEVEKAERAQGHVGISGPALACRMDMDGEGEYILRFSGPVEKLSSVMVDGDYAGDVFNIELFFDGEVIKENGRTLRISGASGRVAAIYTDIHGVERCVDPDHGSPL